MNLNHEPRKPLNTPEGRAQANKALEEAKQWVIEQKAKGNKKVDYAYLSYSSPDYGWVVFIAEKA